MSRTSELQKYPGVVAAGIFSRKGHLEALDGKLTKVEAVELAGLCAAITLTMEMQGRLLGRLADQPGWDSCYGWMTWGPDMAIVAVHDSLCLAHGGHTSFNQLIQAMRESAQTEPIKPGGKGEPNAGIG